MLPQQMPTDGLLQHATAVLELLKEWYGPAKLHTKEQIRI